MPPKTQKTQKTQKKQKSQDVRTLQDTRKSNAIEADDLINDFEEELYDEPETEEEEYNLPHSAPPAKASVKTVKQNKMDDKEHQELLKYRLQQARMIKQRDVETKRQQEQQYLEQIKQQQEKELQKKLKRLANKQKKEIEKQLMNQYLSQQVENDEDEYYQEEEIEVQPTRISRQPYYGRGNSAPPAPPAQQAPARRGLKFF